MPSQILNRIGRRPVGNPAALLSWYSEAIAEILWLYVTKGQHVELLRALVHEVSEVAPALREKMRSGACGTELPSAPMLTSEMDLAYPACLR
jgi:hypothetical protein